MYALGGKSKIDEQPIRKGESKGKIVVDIEKYKITRSFTPKGSYLQVETQEGATFPSPQKLLDSFLADLTFNPLAFAEASPKQQAELLLKVSDIPVDAQKLTDITGQAVAPGNPIDVFKTVHDQLYSERRDINRDLSRQEKVLETLGNPGEVKPVSVTDLFETRKQLEAQQIENDKIRDEVLKLELDAEALSDRICCQKGIVATETQKLKELEKAHEGLKNKLTAAGQASVELVDPDFTEIDRQIEEADEINRKANEAEKYKETKETVDKIKTVSKDYDAKLEKLAEYKKECLSKANFPIKDLGFDDNGFLTIGDVPFSQRGTSQKLLAGCAIGAALNPKLKILLIKDGDKLDGNNMNCLCEWAKDNDYQVWLERVADSPNGVSFFIEEGVLKS
jgi:hypothetical protein